MIASSLPAASPLPSAPALKAPAAPTSIRRHARKTRGFEARIAHAEALLREAAEDHAGRVVQANSLGVEGMVLTDMVARLKLPVAVATLDTGVLHPETLALIPRIRDRYGIEVEVFQPRQEAVIQFVGRHGERAMYESVALRKACCDLRKIEPMQRLLAGRSAWVTGLRREHSEARRHVPFYALEDDGREKFYPLADWTEADVWEYVKRHDVPYNALHDQWYPSIGCAPCTRAISAGEDPRAGRWWWEESGPRECGLHLRPQVASA